MCLGWLALSHRGADGWSGSLCVCSTPRRAFTAITFPAALGWGRLQRSNCSVTLLGQGSPAGGLQLSTSRAWVGRICPRAGTAR